MSLAGTLSEPEAAGALPTAPPLWRIDPSQDESRHLLDGVPDDLEHGMPPSLRRVASQCLGGPNASRGR